MKRRIFACLIILILVFAPNALALEKGNYKSAILVETNTGKVLYESDKDRILPQASITKLMTYFVIRDFVESQNIDLSEKVLIDVGSHKFPIDWVKAGLRDGEKVTLRELIQTMMVYSANDSARQLESYYNRFKPYGYDFIEAMNVKAAELGLRNTHYVNSTGLTDECGYNTTSAYDTALLSMELLKKYPDIIDLTSTKQIIYKGVTLRNWNNLLFSKKGVDGLKTGTTTEAGYCLVSTEDLTYINGNGKPMRLLAVVLGAPSNSDRVNESKKILEYGEQNYENEIVVEKTTIFKYENEYYRGGYIEASLENDAYILVQKNDVIEKSVEFYEDLPRSIKAGAEVGRVNIINLNTNESFSEKLYALKDYKSISLFERIFIFLKNLFA